MNWTFGQIAVKLKANIYTFKIRVIREWRILARRGGSGIINSDIEDEIENMGKYQKITHTQIIVDSKFLPTIPEMAAAFEFYGPITLIINHQHHDLRFITVRLKSV